MTYAIIKTGGRQYRVAEGDTVDVDLLDVEPGKTATFEVLMHVDGGKLSDGGKVTPALFDRFRAEIARLAAEPDTFWTDQFHNTDALHGYAEIGRELLEQTGGRIDVFCGAVGTGGMLAGVAGPARRREPRPHHRARTHRVAGDDTGARWRPPGRRNCDRINSAPHVGAAVR